MRPMPPATHAIGVEPKGARRQRRHGKEGKQGDRHLAVVRSEAVDTLGFVEQNDQPFVPSFSRPTRNTTEKVGAHLTVGAPVGQPVQALTPVSAEPEGLVQVLVVLGLLPTHEVEHPICNRRRSLMHGK